jgi:hypothetical protein
MSSAQTMSGAVKPIDASRGAAFAGTGLFVIGFHSLSGEAKSRGRNVKGPKKGLE